MNTPLTMVVATSGLLLGVGAPKGDAETKADEAAIRGLVQKAAENWSKGDGDAYAALFTEDADYVTFAGTLHKGRREIARSHQQLFAKGSRLVLELKSIRFLNADIAVIHVTGGIVEPGQARLAPERISHQTAVLVKRDGAWLYTASQVTRVVK